MIAEHDTAPVWHPLDVWEPVDQRETSLYRSAYARARALEPQALPGRLLDLVRGIVAQLRSSNKGERV